MILKFSVTAREGVDQPNVARLRQLLDLPDLRTHRDYYVEVDSPVETDALERLRQILGDPITDSVSIGERLQADQVQVAYKRGIVDNENDSIIALARLCGVEANAARVATTYESAREGLAERVAAQCVNPNIEELHKSEPEYETLRPVGEAAPPECFDLIAMTDAELVAVGSAAGRNLGLEQMQVIRAVQREMGLDSVTDVLIEAMDARWSDHCLHTTWRSLGNLLARLVDAARRADNPNVLSMFEDNAGVWDFYDGWAIALKAETHSGPSAVSAYFGQLTKLGGVLRDILGTGLGADPIGSYEYTTTGLTDQPSPVPGRPSARQIGRETIQAIKEYGNTFGVPMMTSRMSFHPAFRAKPFALGGSIGLIPATLARRGTPQPGDMLMVLGGLTGNDGIHGASASSAGSEMDAAAVQIGAPLEQVKFRQGIVDLRDAGCLRALTDVGGAGLNSAIGEIGDPGGVWFNTALVPLKTHGLPTWRILLSESQERMVLAVVPERLDRAREILRRHAVRNTVVGRFTDTGRYCVVHDPGCTEAAVVAANVAQLPDDAGTGFDVPYELLEYSPGKIDVAVPEVDELGPGHWLPIAPADLPDVARRILIDPEVASQRSASSQYDTTVMGHTAYGPGAGPWHVPTSFWLGTPVPGSSAAVVFTTAYDPWLFEAHPVRATRQMFLRAVLAQVLAGAAIEDVCLCDNFYTPHLSETGFGWLVEMVDEVCRLVDVLGTPVISGKDSSAGSVVTPEGVISVPPSVFFSAVGKLPDEQLACRNEWRQAGNLLVRIGPETSSTVATAGARVLDLPAASCDVLDLSSYRRFLSVLARSREMIVSARPIGSGGVLACLLLGALASGLGAEVDPTVSAAGNSADLLAEHRCAAVIEIAEADLRRLDAALEPRVVGRVVEGGPKVLMGEHELLGRSVEDWETRWEANLA